MSVKEVSAMALRNLPSIDELLRDERVQQLLPVVGAARMTEFARRAVDEIRVEMLATAKDPASGSEEDKIGDAARRIEANWVSQQRSSTRRVINATGVVIHTNLGRAPLSEAARQAVIEQAAGYCNVEYDLAAGSRGKRGEHVEELITELTTAESAVVVNNCAAAAFLVLTVLAANGEVVISRGELVEIGGDFRVPDVLAQSGATLREVGTTNRTKIADYERAISENTRLILRVHPSNFRIVGFTATPGVAALADLAQKHGLLLYEDIGSGALLDLSAFGLGDEPLVSRSIKDGADIVTFSGDKLLGGPQAGIIAGRRDLIERIRKHPLYRALRVDKMVYAALEATLEAYRRGTAMDEVPVLKMISTDAATIAERAGHFVGQTKGGRLTAGVVKGSSVIGGGSAPNVHPETTLVAIRHGRHSAETLADLLRSGPLPVITRIEDDRNLIDLRTVSETEEVELLKILAELS